MDSGGGGQVFGIPGGTRAYNSSSNPWWQNYAMDRSNARYEAWVAAGSRTDDDGLWIIPMKVQTRYLHLSSYVVSEGQYVEKGQLIGWSGDVGGKCNCSMAMNPGLGVNPHLHFEVDIVTRGNGVSMGNSYPIDPIWRAPKP